VRLTLLSSIVENHNLKARKRFCVGRLEQPAPGWETAAYPAWCTLSGSSSRWRAVRVLAPLAWSFRLLLFRSFRDLLFCISVVTPRVCPSQPPILFSWQGSSPDAANRAHPHLSPPRTRSLPSRFVFGLHDSRYLPLNLPTQLQPRMRFWRTPQQTGREVSHELGISAQGNDSRPAERFAPIQGYEAGHCHLL
jgi:hypothetical protein